mmetsp:Transcript_28001/g.73890  ORF Transcript_28001/g.73890 Transcript_28001/m.73890 type:complete len:224 (-) Transcript_28001:286-957(-)
MAAFSQSISTLASRIASSPNNFSACKANSWSLRTVLCSSSLAWILAIRASILPNSSLAVSCAMGAKDSTSVFLRSSSRRRRETVLVAAFTARSVSRMALNCNSRSSSTASMASGAATITTFSASSSQFNVFSSKPGNIFSSFAASSSSFFFSLTLSATFRFSSPSRSLDSASSRAFLNSARILADSIRILASLSVSPGRAPDSVTSCLTVVRGALAGGFAGGC